MGDVRDPLDLRQLTWIDLLQRLLDNPGEALSAELDSRLEKLADEEGLRILIPEDRRRVLADVKRTLLTPFEVVGLQAVRQKPELHIGQMLRDRAIEVRQESERRRFKATEIADADLPDLDQILRIWHFIDQLSDRDRALLELAVTRTLTIAEIAERTQVEFAEVASRLLPLVRALAEVVREK